MSAGGRLQRTRVQCAGAPEAIDQWAEGLRRRFGGRPIAVCLEIARGPLVYALQRYPFFVLFPVNPATLAKYRKVFHVSGAKDDPLDAQLALDLLLRHPEKLARLQPQGPAMRILQQLVEQRRALIGDVGRLTNRITWALKQYFPQVLEWFEDKDTVVFCDFLTRWPTLKHAQRARKAPLTAFFHEHSVRYPHVIEQRIQGIASVTERSGNKHRVHWRLHCPRFQRQTFVEFAALSLPHCYWAKAYYEQQLNRGSSRQAALRALAFKWIRIMYRCWQNRTPYNEARYLNALKRRGSPAGGPWWFSG